MVRYADDFVICVQYKDEAEKILKALRGRLVKFSLELSEEKTRIIEFGRFAGPNSKRNGTKPATFNFLGFTHYVDKTRNGFFQAGTEDRSQENGREAEGNEPMAEGYQKPDPHEGMVGDTQGQTGGTFSLLWDKRQLSEHVQFLLPSSTDGIQMDKQAEPEEKHELGRFAAVPETPRAAEAANLP